MHRGASGSRADGAESWVCGVALTLHGHWGGRDVLLGLGSPSGVSLLAEFSSAVSHVTSGGGGLRAHVGREAVCTALCCGVWGNGLHRLVPPAPRTIRGFRSMWFWDRLSRSSCMWGSRYVYNVCHSV